MTNYLCIEDHDIVRAGLRLVMGQINGDATLLEAASLAEGMAVLGGGGQKIDLIILDANLPDASGTTALLTLREAYPEIPIVVMTGQVEGPFMMEVFTAGAVGFIPKSALGTRLRAALSIVQAGERYIPEELLGWIVNNGVAKGDGSVLNGGVSETRKLKRMGGVGSGAVHPLDSLTDRQLEVVHLLAEGYSNKEICRALGLSLGTVKNHVAAILNALGTTSRCKVIHIVHEHEAG